MCNYLNKKPVEDTTAFINGLGKVKNLIITFCNILIPIIVIQSQ